MCIQVEEYIQKDANAENVWCVIDLELRVFFQNLSLNWDKSVIKADDYIISSRIVSKDFNVINSSAISMWMLIEFVDINFVRSQSSKARLTKQDFRIF